MKDQERVPLRIVLRNFLNHIENLESQNCPEKSYEAEFQDLKIFSENVKCLKEYCCLEGEKDVNRKKNRYKDILPFDLSRVVLTEYPGIPGSDYINANFIKGASGSPAYIASQGPLPSTLNDFWRMVVQCEVQVIVMACNVQEAGKAKCEKYWVEEGEEKQFGMISVKLLKASTVCPDFSVRTMRLKYTNSQSVVEERTVCQLHYVAWPDHGVPSVVHPLLDMVRLVRDTQASETLPVLVHCSAGCGRTGTICAIDYVWGLLRTGKLTNDFSLLGLIRDMRKQRIAMVQTKEQYVLVHEAVRELFKEQLTMIDSHPYENIDTNGLLIMKEEENTYDSIEYVSKISHEENCDRKEKDVLPPPLPRKKHGASFSKHEKEVENLTAQQKSIHYSLKNRSNLINMPNIEKTSIGYINIDKNITFKKPQKDIGKNELNKPIPSKGILRVPHLESGNPKSTHTVKRSKSLKVVSSCDKKKFSFCLNSSSLCESKRRSSLESNLDENSFDGDTVTDLEINVDESTKNVQERKVNSVEKYNFFSTQRPLIRSYTTIEMRPKLSLSNTPEKDSISFFDEKMQQRCRLTRSSTHINLVKKSKNNFLSLNMDGNESNSVPLPPTNVKHNFKTSLGHSKSPIRLMKTPMESSTNTAKSQPVYMAKMESSRLQRGQKQKYTSPTTSRTSHNTHTLFSPVPHPNPASHETKPSMKENISFIKISRKTPLSKRLEYPSNPCDDSRQYTKMCNVPCKEDLRRLRLHDNAYMHPRMSDEKGHPHISDPSSSNFDTSSNEGNDGPNYWYDRDNHRNHNFVLNQYDYLNRRKPDFNPTYKCLSEIVKGSRRADTEKESAHEAVSFHVQHCKEQKYISGDKKYGLKNSSHYSISRSKCLPILSPDSATYVSPKHGPPKAKLGEGSHDSSQGEVMPCARVGRDSFHSAPGVDLDQVAASIPHNDGNLMKVALEAFHVRKVKMTTSERSPVKGPVIPNASAGGRSSNPGKKKQQQYL